MSRIIVKGMEKALRTVTDLPKQTRFAAATALNEAAKQIQSNAIDNLLPSTFTLRSKGAPWQRPGTKFGVNIRPFASKTSLTAIVGSQADWLKHQERGGTKTVQGHRLAIPSTFWKRREEIMARNKKPAALLKEYHKAKAAEQAAVASGARARTTRHRRAASVEANTARKRAAAISSLAHKPFLYEGPAMPPGIYVRTADGRLPIQRLFKFQDAAVITTNLMFEEKGKALAESRFDANFRKAFMRAVATAK